MIRSFNSLDCFNLNRSIDQSLTTSTDKGDRWQWENWEHHSTNSKLDTRHWNFFHKNVAYLWLFFIYAPTLQGTITLLAGLKWRIPYLCLFYSLVFSTPSPRSSFFSWLDFDFLNLNFHLLTVLLEWIMNEWKSAEQQNNMNMASLNMESESINPKIHILQR